METIIGIVIIAICWLLYVLYIKFTQFLDEDSKRGEIARKIGKIVGGSFIIYIALCCLLGLIIGFIAIFT